MCPRASPRSLGFSVWPWLSGSNSQSLFCFWRRLFSSIPSTFVPVPRYFPHHFPQVWISSFHSLHPLNGCSRLSSLLAFVGVHPLPLVLGERRDNCVATKEIRICFCYLLLRLQDTNIRAVFTQRPLIISLPTSSFFKFNGAFLDFAPGRVKLAKLVSALACSV